VLHVARRQCKTQKIVKNSPSGHHRTNLSGYIFGTKSRCINNQKNLLNNNTSPHVLKIWWTSAQQYLPTCPQNMVNFSPLTAEIRSGVCRTPANFNGFRVLAL